MPNDNTDAAILCMMFLIETQRTFHTWNFVGLHKPEDALDGGMDRQVSE